MENLGFPAAGFLPFGMALAFISLKHSGMVRFYWAIVVAATLTIIAVVAFSKDKKEMAVVKQSEPVVKVVHTTERP